jgi:hypothetical protein
LRRIAELPSRRATRPPERSEGPRAGLGQNEFRLGIDPGGLQRIIAEANHLGRDDVKVVGFGYDYENNAIVLGPTRAG